MAAITIPKELAKKGDLVVIPLGEYEALLGFKKLKQFTGTRYQKKALLRAERNLRSGKTLSLNELAEKLGSRD